LNKGALDWVQNDGPDVLCLQEIKARPEQLTGAQRESLIGYHEFWNPAVRPGYSGVATLSRSMPLEVQTGVGTEAFDLEGRVIRARYPGFWLFNIYFPSGQRGSERVSFKLEFYACMLELVDRLHSAGEKVILWRFQHCASRDRPAVSKADITTSVLRPKNAWIDNI
jgi:exodeoxyribonuclease-3